MVMHTKLLSSPSTPLKVHWRHYAVGDEATIDDDQIIVHVEVTGAKQNAQAEVIFTNDMFLSMESATLNPVESMGGLMTKAALNTLIGMGTVFVMLV